MQPTLPQTTGAADMDLPVAQSMDWLFKKERIYLLAQFWQQRATLAEKEVNTLKEQLSGSTNLATTATTTSATSSPNSTATSADTLLSNFPPTKHNLAATATTPNMMSSSSSSSSSLNNNNNNNNISSIIVNSTEDNGSSSMPATKNASITNTVTQLNGISPSSPGSPPLSDCGSTASSCVGSSSGVLGGVNLSSNSNNNKMSISTNNKKLEDVSSLITTLTAEMKIHQKDTKNAVLNNNNVSSANNNVNSSSGSCSLPAHQRSQSPSDKNIFIVDCSTSGGNISSETTMATTTQSKNDVANAGNISDSSSIILADELAAKDKEIKSLIDEVTRLQALQDTHIVQIQNLEERLEAERHHILKLEARLENQLDVEDSKKDNSSRDMRPLEIASPAAIAAAAAVAATDAKQFQELFIERTKALAAAQNEALRSANSEGISPQSCATAESPTTKASASEPHFQELVGSASELQATFKPAPESASPSLSTSSVCSDVAQKLLTNNKSQQKPRARSATATPTAEPDQNCSSEPLGSSNYHNVDSFSSFLGEELVSSWQRGFELPPMPLPPSVVVGGGGLMPSMAVSSAAAAAAVAAAIATTSATQSFPIAPPPSSRPSSSAPSTTALLSHIANSNFQNSLQTDQVSAAVNCHQDMDKISNHHDNSSTASTPNLQDFRSSEEHMSGSVSVIGGATSLPPSLIKNSTEDNNNTLGPLQHVPPGFLPALPFQFQERGPFRFADDLQMPPGSMAGRLGESLIPKGDPMEAKLQEMLRYNMDKYANQNLDTLHISRRVRELLSVHNIGQRLFAKYILGLSQGTVSELLSKPKPWDKLTEKGRDSYRKMHAWGCDDNAVLLLKSLIPKKDSGMPQYGRSEDSMSDDRIAHILSEASNLMKTPQGHSHQQMLHHQAAAQHQQMQQQLQQAAQHHQQHQQQHAHQQQQQQLHHQQQQQQHHLSSSHHSSGGDIEDSHSNEDSKSPISRCPSPVFKDSIHRRMKKFEADDIAQDKVARIYQEELAKLMSRAPRDAFPSGGMPPAASQPLPEDNIRMALEAYHRELAKLQQTGGAIPNFPNLPGFLALQQQALNGAQDLSVCKDKSIKVNGQQHISAVDVSDQNTKDSTSAEDALRHSSAFSLVRAKQESGTPAPSTLSGNTPSTAPSPLGNSILPPAMTPTEDFSSAASPLQRMASITNSLITQAPVAPHHSQPQRPMKAVLPPITQQQFDMFNNLNTEDIVRRVKEALSQYSISQRLFGESVLGLSQGSVSDLLARPKPWHMLTQKGREPFIRMKMFLEDENAVHKLVASQYKIAPEKLMRTGNYSGSPQMPPGLVSKMVPMQKMMNDLKMQEPPTHLMQLQASAMATHGVPTSQHQGMLLTPPGLPPHHAISITNSSNEKKPMMMPVHSPQQQQNAMRGMHQHMSPTVYEMAALTQDLDTQIITTKIKEALLANNIGQKIFGEAVLGLSQGSVSELLSKPKPWHMLSIKGREPFIRMQLWLSDANNVERLQAIKNERREASKRRRSTGPGTQDNSSDTSSNDTTDFYTSSPGPGSVGSAGAPPNKKQRVLFSEEQKEALRLAFALDPYPNVATIEFLANELCLATRTITNWFHNHRMRLKQQVPHGAPAEPVPSRENQTGAPFDPVQFRILLNQRLMELQKERMGLSGMPIPYPPYFAANPNLAALISRGLLPGGEPDLVALNNAFKEQMSGLDLSMSSLKRERDEEFDDVDGEDDSHMSDTESLDGSESKQDAKERHSPASLPSSSIGSRTSRRKPAAPQWVNPDWQDGKPGGAQMVTVPGSANPASEHIINGVCVMQPQAADYSRKGADKTVRVEPTAVKENISERKDDENPSSEHEDNEACDGTHEESNKRIRFDNRIEAESSDSEVKSKETNSTDKENYLDSNINGDNHPTALIKQEQQDTETEWNY